jgi:hypothetical protein
MKQFLLLLLLFICAMQLHAQTPVVAIEEDYTAPKSYMYVKGDEYHPRSIENGMYTSKHGSVLPAELKFDLSIDNRQRPHANVLDMEFTLVKIKGKPEDFIVTHIYTNSETPYLEFGYNELGEWKLGSRLLETIYQSGKTQVNPGTNVLRIEYRYRKLRFFLNGVKVCDYEYKEIENLYWQDMRIEAMRKQKTVIGLDKVELKAYSTNLPFSDEAKQQAKTETQPVPPAEAVMGVAPPDPNEVIDYNKVYEPKPDEDMIWFRDKNDYWGAKNAKGEILFQPKFYGPIPFYDGVAINTDGHYSLVNKTGKEITTTQYSNISDFSEGLALASFACNEYGERCRYVYLDKTGKEVLTLPEKYTSAGSFSDGLAVVSKLVSGTGETMSDYRFGYIDKTGNEVIPCTFFNAGDFRYNRAPVESEKYKVGYINKTGQLVIPYKYYKTGEMNDYLFSEGLSAVFLKDPKAPEYMWAYNYCYIDVNGKEVIPFKYNGASDFKDGVAVVALNTDKRVNYTYETKKGLIDKTGKELTPIKYDDIGDFIDGLALVSVNRSDANLIDKAGFIDRTGKEVVPMIYKNAAPFNEGLALIEHSCSPDYPYTCKKSFIDNTGKIVLTIPDGFGIDETFFFSEGLIAVYQCQGEYPDQKCKYGFMDKTGKLVIPLKYDYAEAFGGGLANVELNGEKFKVDKKGTEIKGGKSWMDEEGDY